MTINTKIGNIVCDYIDCGTKSPLLIIAHGKGGHRNTGSKKIAEYLQSFNVSSLRIDLYGHGESDGKYENITISSAKESILGAIEYAKKNLKYSGLFLFSTSYGGNGILAALPDLSSSDISGLILRCTIPNYWNKTLREFSVDELEQWKVIGYINEKEKRLSYSFVEDMKNYASLNYSKLAKFETLYFYAGKDTKVLKAEVDEIRTQVPEKFHVITYPNSTHGIDIQEDYDDMIIKTKEFIESISNRN